MSFKLISAQQGEHEKDLTVLRAIIIAHQSAFSITYTYPHPIIEMLHQFLFITIIGCFNTTNMLLLKTRWNRLSAGAIRKMHLYIITLFLNHCYTIFET